MNKNIAKILFVVAIISTLGFFFNLGNSFFSSKTYAKCKFDKIKNPISTKLYSEFRIEYFAFDNEKLYYHYSIADKDFNMFVKHESGKELIKTSTKFYKGDDLVSLKFDGSIGNLSIIVDNKETLNFICEKILKSQLPKSKF
tara:strand:- start:203 stop:628 length:426 start_codon:yes stop_codon:yes gene_type:complete